MSNPQYTRRQLAVLEAIDALSNEEREVLFPAIVAKLPHPPPSDLETAMRYIQRRAAFDKVLDKLRAASRRLNPRNQESPWEALYATTLRKLVADLAWTFSVQTEYDVWIRRNAFHAHEPALWSEDDFRTLVDIHTNGDTIAFLAAMYMDPPPNPDPTLRYDEKNDEFLEAGDSLGDDHDVNFFDDAYYDQGAEKTIVLTSDDLAACRPDLVILLDILRARRERNGLVRYFVVGTATAVIVELKRSPPRDDLDVDTGFPKTVSGHKALKTKMILAMNQSECQGALYLRTPVGRQQKVVMLIAGSEGCVAWAFMTRESSFRSGHNRITMLCSRLESLKVEEEDMDKEEEEAAARAGNQADSEQPTTFSLPELTADDLSGLGWTKSGWRGVRRADDVQFQSELRTYLRFCERDLRSVDIRDTTLLIPASDPIYMF